jgi:GNAT superfamily N-acetyltransferase
MERQALSHQAISERFGRPANEVIRLTDQHTLAIQRWLSTRAPGAVICRENGVTVTSSGLGVALFNLALGGQFEDEATLDQEIEAIRAFFEERRVPWAWWIGPQVHPPDLLERLERRDLAPDMHLPALAARLPGATGPAPPDVHVWLAASLSDLQAASAIRRIAFRFPPGQALDYFQACTDDWLKGGRAPHYARLYLARAGDGPPAAIGALIMGAGYPGVYVMATLPDWRRRGLGRAIMARLMQDANATGCPLAFLTASRFGYPLYRRFGFEHVFDYRIVRKT